MFSIVYDIQTLAQGPSFSTFSQWNIWNELVSLCRGVWLTHDSCSTIFTITTCLLVKFLGFLQLYQWLHNTELKNMKNILAIWWKCHGDTIDVFKLCCMPVCGSTWYDKCGEKSLDCGYLIWHKSGQFIYLYSLCRNMPNNKRCVYSILYM